MSSIRYTNFDGLLNAGTSDFLMLDNELSACKNVWTYKLGRLEKVPGYTKATTNLVIASADTNYLHHYYDTANSTDYMLATADDGSDLTLRYRTTSTWSTIGSISTSWDTYAGSQPSMENFLGKAFIVGYKSGTTFLPNATISATTFSTADSDISSMPQGKYIVKYRDLLYVLHAKTGGTVYPSRAYYSDEISAGAIGWTGIATNFVTFGYDDGDEITGAVEAYDRLIVFKKNSMWKYDETSVKKIADIGCDSFRSIVKINGAIYWYNTDGVWRYTGSTPVLISKKVQPFIDAIDQTAKDSVVGSEYSGNEYRCFIGDVTVNNISYTNTWICIKINEDKCYIRCTTSAAKSTCTYIESGKIRTYFGDDTGWVWKFAHKVDNIYTENSAEIDSFFITKALDYGVPEYTKFNNHLTVFSNYSVGMKCAIEKDNSGVFNEENIPILKKNVEDIDTTAHANRFRYKFYEKGGGKSWEFEGMVIETELEEESK